MSINLFNKELGRWEKTSSVLAASSKVLDVNGNYQSENVEGCLKEIAEDIVQAQKDIKYIFDNGVGGGGGGGGGGGTGVAPVLECTFDQTVFKTGEAISIPYFVTCPKIGKFIAYYSIDNTERNKVIQLGKNQWDVGVLPKGKHTLKLYITNSDGLISNVFTCNITVGALELTSRFNPNLDFMLTDQINVQYTLSNVLPSEATVIRTIDGISAEISQKPGSYTWEIGTLDKGLHTITLSAKSGDNVSNVLTFNIIISDSTSLFIVTPNTAISSTVDERLILEYRISIQGVKKFKTYATINSIEQPVMNTILGKNFWQLGYLATGVYNIQLYVTTEDGLMRSNTLNITITIAPSDFIPIEPIYDGLLAYYNADKKNNSEMNRNVWEDLSPSKKYPILLKNLNYNTNGWIDGALVLNGESYGIIDFMPFKNAIPDGFTFDIQCRTRNTGDLESRVVSCEENENPFIGLQINPFNAGLKAASSGLKVEFSEDCWTRFTFVVNRAEEFLFIYINGVICKVVEFSNEEAFSHDEKVYLNCMKLQDGTLGHFGSCEIRNIRIYDHALNHEEILQNHISDMTPLLQKATYLRNYGSGLPEMHITGNMEGMTEKVKKTVKVVFTPRGGQGEAFSLPKCLVGWQGTSSLAYAVKNYRLFLRDEDDGIFKIRMTPQWQPDDIYTLKANMMDSTQAHNIGAAKFIPKIYTQKTPAQLENPQLRTTIDGFPFILYIDDTSLENHKPQMVGIYDFNIDKKASAQFGLNPLNPLHEAYIGDSNADSSAVAFKVWDDLSITQSFEVIHPDVDNKTHHPSLSSLIQWVANATDGDFKRELPQHFNVDFLIDYFLIVLMFGMVDSLGKNLVLRTFDGQIWYPGFYDMDTMLGMNNSGAFKIRPSVLLKHETFSPFVSEDQDQFNTSKSILWEKVMRLMYPEIFLRYQQLRENFFKTEQILEVYEKQIIEQIGELYYNKDAYAKYLVWKDEYLNMCNGNRLEQIKRWLNERIIFLDSHFKYGKNYSDSVTIRVARNVNVRLRIKTYSPTMVTIDFGSDAFTFTKLCTPNEWTEFSSYVDSKDREVMIYSAGNILAIDGIKDIEVEALKLANATKLIELDCSNSPDLTELNVSDNINLQKLDCSNCVKLGTADTGRTMNLSKCVNLKYLNCSFTKLTGITLGKGGSLKYVNLSNTMITSVTLEGQEFLDNIYLSNCMYLDTFKLSTCNRLKTLIMPGTSISEFNISDCLELANINVSQTPALKIFGISNCPSLKILNISGTNIMPGTNGKAEIDLKDARLIEELYIAQCTTLDQVRFATDCNSLKKLDASNAGLSAIGFGNNMGVDTIDLGRFTLNYLSFRNCPNVKQITNVHYVCTNNSDIFKDCAMLMKVTGKLTIKGSMNNTFYGCRLLSEIPELDLSETTQIYDGFSRCEKIPSSSISTVFYALKNIETINGLFVGCKNLKTQLPADLLKNCKKLVTFYNVFSECSELETTLPTGFFDAAIELADVSGSFSGCAKLKGSIPDTLFALNPEITNTESMFSGCIGITGAFPKNLFKTTTRLKNVKGMFSDCEKMTGELSDDLFKYTTFLKEADYFLSGCTALSGTIPVALFAKTTLLSSATAFFLNCKMLTGTIPAALFSGCKNVFNLSSFIENCKSLTGTIPEGLFTGLRSLQNLTSFFKGCKSITGSIPPTLLSTNESLIFINYLFSECDSLTTDLPATLFAGTPNILEARAVFQKVTGINGTIPPNLFNNLKKVTHLSNFFDGCDKLISEIPSNLFANCVELTSVEYFFGTCLSLFGTIPSDLMTNCKKLKQVQSLFYGCNKLTGAIPNYLFRENPEINNVSFLFCGCNLTGSIPGSLFANCPKIEDATSLFHNTSGLTGDIPSNLFSNTPLIRSFYSTFRGCNKLGRLPSTLFANTKEVTNFEATFTDCTGLTGEAIKLWETHSKVLFSSGCYKGCEALTNYNLIPSTWK